MRLINSFPLLATLAALASFAQTGAPRRTVNPHGPLKVACESCHTAGAWSPIRPHPEFDHNSQTAYPLRGRHEGVACGSCHVVKVFRNTSNLCSSCHADFHRGKNGANCQECHTVKGWQVAVRETRQHSNRFPLLGAHSLAPCESCHKGAATGIYTGLSTDCQTCHLKDYGQSRNPPHAASRFPLQCDQCHTMDGWAGAKFDHAAVTQFALTGAHSKVQCASCHVGGRFAGTSTQCIDCHTAQFTGVQNPNHVQAGFPRDCSMCHTNAQWAGAKFDHTALTKFTLTGAHTQAQCVSCHLNGRYAGTPMNCDGCHQNDFNKTSNPNHTASNFPRDCAQCHTPAQWSGAKFDHNLSRFQLAGAHTQVQCSSCHIGGRFTGTPVSCDGCHTNDFNKTVNPSHTAAGFPKDCSICHTTVQWSGAKFNHAAQTKFPLTGAHASLDCASCHAKGKFAGIPSTCDGCHNTDFNKTTNPNHSAAGFPADCSQCHTTTQWKGGAFDHSTKTKFPLTGAHSQVQCSQCHVGDRFAGTPATCDGCHMPDYNKTVNPNHVAAGFPHDCAVCHTNTQWKGGRFDHAKTKFPLTGTHAQTQCAQCHADGRYAGTSMNCDSCHIADYNKAANPNHVAAGFPRDCSVCHTTAQWKAARFDHSSMTKFALTGAHTSVQCSQCHVGGKFAGTPAACAGCHIADFNKTTSPNHAQAGFPQNCEICHTTTQWKGAKFDHSRTRFSLTGTHLQAQCEQCHVGGRFAGTPTNCDSCHIADYNKTTNPNHAAAGFPKDCSVCHGTTQFKGARFDHASMTKFPLTGTHTSLQCNQCHTSGVFQGLPSNCDSCHITDYNKTTNPNHAAAGFPKDCSVCHTTTQFRGARFDHASMTKFPLTGTHASLQCTQCHTNGVYKGLPANCDSCHIGNYSKTTNPNHVAAGFPKDCSLCHTTAQWPGAKFDHTAMTKFPLTGTHTGVQCAQCHVNGIYKGLPANCDSCHINNYNKTTNPNHVAAGFPKDCSLCHTPTQWLGAKFDHSKTRFPLVGTHTSAQCSQCHANGVYRGLPMNCDSCHINDYNRTASPNHVQAGFPKDCSICHTPTQWRGAKFDHTSMTKFPLTGMHTSLQCVQCHSDGVFAGRPMTCDSCHINDYTKTTSPNHVQAGFPKDCAACHNTTQWKGAKFDHTSMTKFPLTGAHTAVQCSQCHSSGVYAGLPMNCDSCHINDYTKTTSPNHVQAGFPKTCSLCHTTAQWPGAKFDHTAMTKFPLTGTHTTLQCSQCHSSGVYAGLPKNCDSCHIATYTSTTNPKHSAAGFPKDCSLCHSTTNWLGAKFDHTAMTKFPLTGTHTTLQCSQCHSDGVYAGRPTTCDSCHIALYNSVTNPNHVTAGFPKDCSVCHNTTAFRPASFDHSKTRFALTGAHTTVQCALCHVGGRFAGTPMDCYSCHQSLYQTVSSPNHVAAGFPHTCTQCHTTTTFAGATFNHTSFPIYSGIHNGKWTSCSDCHTAAADFSVFSCINCHQHVQTTVDPRHKSVKNYIYAPTTCYQCHPQGRAG